MSRMDAIRCIMTRRSIRHYESRDVPQEMVEKMLKAAMMAPSAKNQQPWRFIVINDRKTLDKIPDIQPYSNMLKEAPLGIAVCAETEGLRSPDYWVQDCSAATENLLLAAHALGLGAVWLGFYPDKERTKELMQLLDLPKTIIPLNVVSIGFPAESKVSDPRFDPDKIRYNRWS